MIEIGLLDFGGKADHSETGVQQGLGDVGSEAAVGSGNECSFSFHWLVLQVVLRAGPIKNAWRDDCW